MGPRVTGLGGVFYVVRDPEATRDDAVEDIGQERDDEAGGDDDGGLADVGGQDELGYFFPNESGTLIYHSIKELIPAGERQFADIWDIHLLKDEIFFRTVNKIFRLKNNKIDVYITRNAWVYAGKVNNELLAHENKIGLKYFKASMQGWEINRNVSTR